jgi:hypothetical protein
MRRNLVCSATAAIVFATFSSGTESPAACKVFGMIFSADPVGGTLLLKDEGGYLKSVRLPSGSVISKLPVGPGGQITKIGPTDLNTGDLLCAQGGDEGAAPHLSVVTRADLHRAQANFLLKWHRDSLYGKLSSIDVRGRTLEMTPLPPWVGDTPVRVSLPASVRLRSAAPNARHISESTSFALEDLQPGETVYVRGSRSDNGPDMAASLVLKGGYRGILGTLVEVQVLSSTLRVREFGTDEILSIKMTPGETYRTTENLKNPMRVETASGVVLAPVGLADLQIGDAILVVGKTTSTTVGEGLVAVTKFGTFGVAPEDPNARVSWLLAK